MKKTYVVTIRRPVIETYAVEVEAETQQAAVDATRHKLEECGNSFFVLPSVRWVRTSNDIGLIRASHIKAACMKDPS